MLLKNLKIFLLTILLASAATAQEYLFKIPSAEVTVTIEKQGSAYIHYKLNFECMNGAHPIDIVDIGMPATKHEPVSAAVNGMTVPRSSIRKSTYIDNGYEVHLGAGTIRPGSSGVFEFTGRSYNMVWQDTIHDQLASFRFTPTWFGSQYVRGKTQLMLRFSLPPGEYPDPDKSIIWHKNTPPFTMKGIVSGEKAPSVVWKQQVSLTGPNMFGVSFPREYVSSVQKMNVFILFYRWFAGNVNVRIVSGFIILLLFTIVFFTTTRGTGWAVYIILFIAVLLCIIKSPGFHLWLYPVILGLGFISYIFRHNNRKTYIPASVSREGGRVLSNLTAVEAAVVLNLPVNRILTIIIFDLARRHLLEILSTKPIKITVAGSILPGNKWKLPNGNSVHLMPYEREFLQNFRVQSAQSVEDMYLEPAFKFLVDSVKRNIRGCDLERSREYCKYKVEQIWKKIEKETDLEIKDKTADKNIAWLMLDEEHNKKFDLYERDGYYYRPSWYHGHGVHHHAPSYTGEHPVVPPVPSGSADTASFSDLFDTVSGRLSNFSDSIKTLSVNDAKSLDLSFIDEITNDMLTSSSSGGGGYSGGGCACACAGCACACACAGGGR